DEPQLELLRGLDPRSWIAVPLRSRGKMLGSIAFVRSESGRRYGPAEKEVALEVVDRAATSVDNCMLYEELVRAGRHKDDFLAMLGHELRNPLAAIQYSVALSKTLPERAAWANDTISRQVDHLARLVDDLLDVSRITRNAIELKKETVDLNDVVKRAVGTS